MNPTESCLNCRRSSQEIPLLRLKYKTDEYSICPQCLPILIHKPEQMPQLAGKWTETKVEHEH